MGLELLNQVTPIFLASLKFIRYVSVCPIVRHHLLGRHLNACNAIDNHNMMRQSDLGIYGYWVT